MPREGEKVAVRDAERDGRVERGQPVGRVASGTASQGERAGNRGEQRWSVGGRGRHVVECRRGEEGGGRARRRVFELYDEIETQRRDNRRSEIH